MTKEILSIEHLSKAYRSHWTFRPTLAVKDLSLKVFENEAFGFLGSNGAGKTTTIKCIIGLVHKTKGEIKLFGKPLTSADQHMQIGYLPEQPYFYDHLTVKETLEFFAALHEIPATSRSQRIEQILEMVELEHKKHSKVQSLSKGLQQRLGFGQAILNNPSLLILDEPFSGLDPLGRMLIRKLILSMKEQGSTILMSSHILSDVEDICDRVCILHEGETKDSFHIADSAKRFGEQLEFTLSGLENNIELRKSIAALAEQHETEPASQGTNDVFIFFTYESAVQALLLAIQNNIRLLAFKSGGMKLEDIFVRITQGEDAMSISASRRPTIKNDTTIQEVPTA